MTRARLTATTLLLWCLALVAPARKAKKFSARKANDRAIEAFAAGEEVFARKLLNEVVEHSPFFAAAWRSLAWIAQVSPYRDVDDGDGEETMVRHVTEAGRCSRRMSTG